MSSEWSVLSLRELADIKHGWAFKSDFFSESPKDNPIVVGIGNFKYEGGFRFENTKIKYYEGDYPEDYLLESGDILLVMTCQTAGGEILGIPGKIPGDNKKYLHNQRLGKFINKRRDLLDDDYAYNLFKSADFNRFLASSASGTKILHTSPDRILQYSLELPPVSEQKAIAHILGTLDDKIELNRKTNETLEAIAKALFKSWFVDFDLVRAKAEGRPTGLPAEISDLFPDSFEDSELGEIPSGWRIDSIYSVASVVYGAPFSSSLFNADGTGIPVARIRDLPGESPGVYTTEVHPKGTLILPGDIVVGMDGEFRAYLWGGEECWMNQRVCKFIPGKKGRTCFLRESIRKPLMDVEMSETATTVIHLGKGDIDGFRVVVPTQEILDIFSAATTPLYEEVVANKQQTRVLANIRDALLSKLISGEIRIPDAEKMLEEVGV
jgi:type I restriction enzyme, S subunit